MEKTNYSLGEGIGIQGKTVAVRYQDRRDQTRELTLNSQPDAPENWRVGERVGIYSTNWTGAKGVEKNNGDAFKVDQKK